MDFTCELKSFFKSTSPILLKNGSSKKSRLLYIFENLKLQLLHKQLEKKAKKRGLLEKIQQIFA